MPGIVGIFSSTKTPSECRALTRSMLERIVHEPTYRTGTLEDSLLGIYCGWAVHPGSFAAQQSGQNTATGLGLAFSGECNDDDFFSAGMPNDWVSQRYEKEGAAFVSSLNGLFSGLLIDSTRQQALLFNDRYGIERIYYHETPDALYFASEAKALLCVLPETRAFDDEGVAQYLAYGCTLGSRTLFRGIQLADGGSCWSFKKGQPVQKTRYFTPVQWEEQPTISEEQFDEEFFALFPKIFPKYTRTNQKLGVSLTGGFDSRMVMSCLPPDAKPECYTYSGRTEKLLDSKIAARLAHALGLNHQELRIKEDFLENFTHWVDRSVYISDGFCGALGAHEIYYSKSVRDIAPVRLTGNFGSEVLRSVSTFKPQYLLPGTLATATDAAVTRVKQQGTGTFSPVTFSAFNEVPRALFGTLCTGRSQVTFRTPYLDNELVALAFRAPMSARTSPLPALRFLGRINPQLARIPTDRGEIGVKRGPAWLARRTFAEVTFKLDYMFMEGPPKKLAAFDPFICALKPFGILGLHKFLPYRHWFRNELKQQLRGTLTSQRIRELPYFNPPSIESTLTAHLDGRMNRLREINAVLTLEAIDRLLLRAKY